MNSRQHLEACIHLDTTRETLRGRFRKFPSILFVRMCLRPQMWQESSQKWMQLPMLVHLGLQIRLCGCKNSVMVIISTRICSGYIKLTTLRFCCATTGMPTIFPSHNPSKHMGLTTREEQPASQPRPRRTVPRREKVPRRVPFKLSRKQRFLHLLDGINLLQAHRDFQKVTNIALVQAVQRMW